tara:strand:- start:3356 stop:3871 length:516 start_codon:yes stop_codon:yes gene_type:complete
MYLLVTKIFMTKAKQLLLAIILISAVPTFAWAHGSNVSESNTASEESMPMMNDTRTHERMEVLMKKMMTNGTLSADEADEMINMMNEGSGGMMNMMGMPMMQGMSGGMMSGTDQSNSTSFGYMNNGMGGFGMGMMLLSMLSLVTWLVVGLLLVVFLFKRVSSNALPVRRQE